MIKEVILDLIRIMPDGNLYLQRYSNNPIKGRDFSGQIKKQGKLYGVHNNHFEYKDNDKSSVLKKANMAVLIAEK